MPQDITVYKIIFHSQPLLLVFSILKHLFGSPTQLGLS